MGSTPSPSVPKNPVVMRLGLCAQVPSLSVACFGASGKKTKRKARVSAEAILTEEGVQVGAFIIIWILRGGVGLRPAGGTRNTGRRN